MFYRIANDMCIKECPCGESEVKNYKHPRTGALYPAVCLKGELPFVHLKLYV